MKRLTLIAIVTFTVLGIGVFLVSLTINIGDQWALMYQPSPSIPETSASAVTSPPSSLDGINTHIELYGTGADPDMITLGPKTGGQEGWQPYPTKSGMEFEVEHGTPILAPLDMVLVGFDNRNAKYRIRDNGEVQTPYDDLELYFESASPEWPGMVITMYHLTTSPLLLAQDSDQGCDRPDEWKGTVQAQGRKYSTSADLSFRKQGDPESCVALLGKLVRRGEVIGYAGSVGNHSMVAFRFKVPSTEVNPTVKFGNKYLHWVQPGSFFYWKCYSPETDFPSGVLGYPFPCDGYELPSEQKDLNFKYSE